MSTHDGFVDEFPFYRFDCFKLNDVHPSWKAPPVAYFLTHAHTDHLVGLGSPSFNSTIYCTSVTKALVLNSITAADRVMVSEAPMDQMSTVREDRLKFKNLRKNLGNKGKVYDKMVVLEYNRPVLVANPWGSQEVKVTAIDANHCPGSAMFLVEGIVNGTFKSIIVTGDIRAEPMWVDQLLQNPILKPYFRTLDQDNRKESSLWRRLDCIYFDTTFVLRNVVSPTKKEGVDNLVRIMKLYPANTTFFLNAWTHGYEEMLTGVSEAFDQPIRLDWFKSRLFNEPALRLNYPCLSRIGTMDSKVSTRFHACERRWKCDDCWGNGVGCYDWPEEDQHMLYSKKAKKRVGGGLVDNVVRINPAGLSREGMSAYCEKMMERVTRVNDRANAGITVEGVTKGSSKSASYLDQRPKNLLVAIDRHSSLPELLHFISIFRPASLYPLTMSKNGRHGPYPEYGELARLFKDVLPGKARLKVQRAAGYFIAERTGDSQEDLMRGTFARERMVHARNLSLSQTEGVDTDEAPSHEIFHGGLPAFTAPSLFEAGNFDGEPDEWTASWLMSEGDRLNSTSALDPVPARKSTLPTAFPFARSTAVNPTYERTYPTWESPSTSQPLLPSIVQPSLPSPLSSRPPLSHSISIDAREVASKADKGVATSSPSLLVAPSHLPSASTTRQSLDLPQSTNSHSPLALRTTATARFSASPSSTSYPTRPSSPCLVHPLRSISSIVAPAHTIPVSFSQQQESCASLVSTTGETTRYPKKRSREEEAVVTGFKALLKQRRSVGVP